MMRLQFHRTTYTFAIWHLGWTHPLRGADKTLRTLCRLRKSSQAQVSGLSKAQEQDRTFQPSWLQTLSLALVLPSHWHRRPCPVLCCGLPSARPCLCGCLSGSVRSLNPGAGYAEGFALLPSAAWVTRHSLWTEVEARRSGREEKFRSLGRMRRRERGDFIVLQCGDVWVQDKGPGSPHCSSGRSEM